MLFNSCLSFLSSILQFCLVADYVKPLCFSCSPCFTFLIRQRVNMSSWDQLPGSNNNPDQSEIKKLKQINEKQEKWIQALEAKALQLTNLYFVFQGVILSTSATARSIKCHHWWIPFVLSLLAAIPNLFAFYFTIEKILSCIEHFDQNSVDLDVMRSNEGVTMAEVVQVLPGGQLNREGVQLFRAKPDPCKKWWCRVLAYASIGLSLGFSGVVLYGCHALLC